MMAASCDLDLAAPTWPPSCLSRDPKVAMTTSRARLFRTDNHGIDSALFTTPDSLSFPQPSLPSLLQSHSFNPFFNHKSDHCYQFPSQNQPNYFNQILSKESNSFNQKLLYSSNSLNKVCALFGLSELTCQDIAYYGSSNKSNFYTSTEETVEDLNQRSFDYPLLDIHKPTFDICTEQLFLVVLTFISITLLLQYTLDIIKELCQIKERLRHCQDIAGTARDCNLNNKFCERNCLKGTENQFITEGFDLHALCYICPLQQSNRKKSIRRNRKLFKKRKHPVEFSISNRTKSLIIYFHRKNLSQLAPQNRIQILDSRYSKPSIFKTTTGKIPSIKKIVSSPIKIKRKEDQIVQRKRNLTFSQCEVLKAFSSNRKSNQNHSLFSFFFHKSFDANSDTEDSSNSANKKSIENNVKEIIKGFLQCKSKTMSLFL